MIIRRLITRTAWSDVFIAFIVCLGLLGGGAMSFWSRYFPTAVIALFLAIGVAALIYRFLGGFQQGPSALLNGIQIGGSLGALVLVFRLLNQDLTAHPSVISQQQDLAGKWRWQWAAGGWDGTLTLRSHGDKLTVDGFVKDATDPNEARIWDITDGEASLTEDGTLRMSFLVTDFRFGGVQYRLTTEDRLIRGTAFSGHFMVDVSDPRYREMRQRTWGFEMARAGR
jgi:hypothetical protein